MEINRIYNVDCLEGMKEMEDNSVDLVLTDPPYGIGINKMNFTQSGAVKVGGAYRNDYTKHNLEWDSKRISKEYFDEIFRIGKHQIIFGGNYYTDYLKASSSWIVWDKRTHEKYNNDFADCELAWTSHNKPARIFRYLYSGMIQGDMKHKEERFHPTQKPVKLFEWILNKYSNENDLILDPFLGSGTTAVAALKTNRRFIGFEISKEYCDIANKRIKPWIEQEKLSCFQE